MTQKATKTTRKDFDRFRRHVMDYVKLFGLRHVRVYFKHALLEDGLAQISFDRDGFTTLITLSKIWKEPHQVNDEQLKEVAKHEAIHLLLSDFASLAEVRFCSKEELERAEEKVVSMLCNLL